MIHVVLDTNTLVSGFGWRSSAPGRVVDHALAKNFVFVTSEVLLAELDRVIRYPKLAKHFPDPDGLVKDVRGMSLIVEPKTKLHVVSSDEDDNRVLEVAQAGDVEFVVSGDQDLLDLGTFEKTRIVTPSIFLAEFEPDGERAS